MLRPINDSGSSAAFKRTAAWLHECLTHHTACNENSAGVSGPTMDNNSSSVMPHRVLDLNRSQGSRDCRLIIGDGIRDHYVALSHCWGSLQLLTTRKDTIEDRMKVIPWLGLPKTFQDAVTVCRNLNIQYLWIDSLCIVQDDAQDWKEQSAQMGSVYQNSYFTLAATGAPDGRAGLFLPRPDMLTPVKIMYPLQDGTKPDHAHVGMHADQVSGGIDSSPLDDRAWITQEWLLSRRMVHFTQARLVWSCSTLSESEDGEIVLSGEGEGLRELLASGSVSQLPLTDEDFYGDWCDIVRSYCSRSWTYETDKPVAIQGLIAALRSHRDELCSNGVWHREDGRLSSSQVLWYGKYAPSPLHKNITCNPGLYRPQSLVHLPSWSWMSTMGNLQFHGPAKSAEDVAEHVLSDECTLRMRTHLVKMPLAWGPVMPDTSLGERYPFSSWFSPASFRSGGMVSPHGLYLLGDCGARFGWASFDASVLPVGDVFCCVISKTIANDRRLEGLNVLLLQHRGTTYCRLGMGEIIDAVDVLKSPKVDVSVS